MALEATVHLPSGDRRVALPDGLASFEEAVRELAYQIMKRVKEYERDHGAH